MIPGKILCKIAIFPEFSSMIRKAGMRIAATRACRLLLVSSMKVQGR